MPDVFVVGSFFVGITVRVPRIPVPGEALIGDLFDYGPGGKGTNQAVAAARLGAQVNLLACIGDDIFGETALSLFRQEGMSLDYIHQIAGVNTGVGCVTLLPTGENMIVGHPGANNHMRPEHVDAAEPAIAESGIVMCQLEVPIEVVTRAMELGHKHSVMTILNPAPAQPLRPELLPYIDLLTPNETEVRMLLGFPPDDPTPTLVLAKRIVELGAKRLVVTQGRRGALIVTPDGSEEIPSVAIQAVDTTGAGDSFNAALAVGLGEGMSLRDAVQRANLAGAYTAMHLGVIDGLPSRSSLDTFAGSFASM